MSQSTKQTFSFSSSHFSEEWHVYEYRRCPSREGYHPRLRNEGTEISVSFLKRRTVVVRYDPLR